MIPTIPIIRVSRPTRIERSETSTKVAGDRSVAERQQQQDEREADAAARRGRDRGGRRGRLPER